MTSSRFAKLSSLTAILVMATTSVASIGGCAGQGDIDRTQPDKVDKSMFLDAKGAAKIFYFRQTYVGVPETTTWSFEGTQTSLMKVRFDITEDYLVGYRANDYVPGSENPFTDTTNNQDTPIVKYKISSQFDVKREYNPGTGEQTNVISENTTDRPWDQRQYMRVDWSANLADWYWDDSLKAQVQPSAYSVSETDYKNPDYENRPIVQTDYIDFVQKQMIVPDFTACQNYYPGIDDGGPFDCGNAEIQIRNSFMAVKPSSYVPLEYPDNYPILDASGNPVEVLPGGYRCTADTFKTAGGQYDGNDCTPATVGGFSKFGFFRTVVQTYNRGYGATEEGRKYYANRWNIWADVDAQGVSVFNKDGSIRNVPLANRKIKPIVYYTNIEFPASNPADPDDLYTQAQAVVKDWSGALQKTVAGMLLAEKSSGAIIPPDQIDALAAKQDDMVVLKQNSCNLPAVQKFLADNPKVGAVVETATGLTASAVDLTHLGQVCSIMEAETQTLADGDTKKFTWQRNGDLRYSFFYWVDRPAPTTPLGYGPSSADPETGEIVSASLYNYGAALDTYAQQSADMVDLINNNISVDDLLSGKTIADVLKETSVSHAARAALPVTPEARSQATTMLRRGGTKPGSSRLLPIPGGTQDSRLSLIKGTDIERQMMTPDILAAFLPNSKPGDTLTADQIAQASPVTWMSQAARDQRRQHFQNMAMYGNGCAYLGEFADDAILGLALELKKQGLTGQPLVKNLRHLIFRGLADHEMGHTMGLRHNFAGSSDALNYGDSFWKIRSTVTPDQWDANKISEYRYSTVMDYGSRFNSDVNGLGKYDYAAIRFGYGGLIDVMPSGPIAKGETGIQLENDIFLQDYTKLPALTGGSATDTTGLENGGVLSYQTVRDSLTNAYETADPTKGGSFITPERPYKFCSDEYEGNLDCKTWDFGANQSEIVDDAIDRFKNYFVFNAFQRGRVNWTINGYLNRLLERYFTRYTEAYQFYYFYGDLLAGTDLADDLLKASIDSMNALGEVLQTPEPGEHCPTAMNPNVLAIPDPSTSATSCISGSQSMEIQIPDGKPYYINFSGDYYYRITRAGSLYEKLAALISLTTTQARFFRVDTFAAANEYAVNYYSIFKDQMISLLSGVIRGDSASYGGYVPNAGTLAGSYQPTPVVDLTTYGVAKPTVPDYLKPGVKRVDTPVNKTIQYYALGLSLSNLNSSWDSTLDLAQYMAVTVKGSKEDVAYGPSVTVLEYEHPQSGLVYRAPILDNTNAGVAVPIVQELQTITGQKGVPGVLPEKYGAFKNQPLPDWQTAKANLDAAQAAAQANTDTTKTAALQQSYSDALSVFQGVDYQLSYRVDLLDDLRNFRTAFGY
jgi:Met-zincin